MIDRACISLNARCNLNCEYCHFGQKKNTFNRSENEFKQNELSEIIQNLIEYIKANKIEIFKLGIVGAGEPLLNFKDISFLVEQFKSSEVRKNIKLYTITNGTILTDDMLVYFYENREIIDLNFSLDGYKKLHEINRPMFNVTMGNISKYESLFGHKPLVNAVVTRETIINHDEVIDFFTKNHFEKVNFSIIFGVENENLLVSSIMYKTFIDECHNRGLIMRQKLTNEKRYDCTKYGNLCGVGRTNVFISKSGIYPCSRFLGNKDYKLSDFYESFFIVEKNLNNYQLPKDGECYYETEYLGGKVC